MNIPTWPAIATEIATEATIEKNGEVDHVGSCVMGHTMIDGERLTSAVIVPDYVVKCLTAKALTRRVKPQLIEAMREAIASR